MVYLGVDWRIVIKWILDTIKIDLKEIVHED
jgi:hypothetical protein